MGHLKWMRHPLHTKYNISTRGGVVNTKNMKAIKQSASMRYANDGSGKIVRLNVNLTTDVGNKINIAVHLLVMACFGPEKPNTPGITVDHIDRNPTNNDISNLRWATLKEQTINKTRRRKNDIKISAEELDIIYKRHEKESLSEIAIDYRMSKSDLCKLLMYMHPKY